MCGKQTKVHKQGITNPINKKHLANLGKEANFKGLEPLIAGWDVQGRNFVKRHFSSCLCELTASYDMWTVFLDR